MADPDTRVGDILGRCEVLADASDAAREILARAARRVEVERRDALFEQGSPAADLLVLASGRIRLLRRGKGDREITLGYRSAGEVAGETGWVDGIHHAEGVAVDRVEALRIPRAALEEVLVREPRIAIAFFALIGRRVRELEQRMEALLTRAVESRVAEFLLDAAGRHGVPDPRGRLIGVKFTHQEIASYVGSTRETVTLILGELKRRGLIGTDHRRVIVRDQDELSKLV